MFVFPKIKKTNTCKFQFDLDIIYKLWMCKGKSPSQTTGISANPKTECNLGLRLTNHPNFCRLNNRLTVHLTDCLLDYLMD